MVLRYFSEAYICSTRQELMDILWNLKEINRRLLSPTRL